MLLLDCHGTPIVLEGFGIILTHCLPYSTSFSFFSGGEVRYGEGKFKGTWNAWWKMFIQRLLCCLGLIFALNT